MIKHGRFEINDGKVEDVRQLYLEVGLIVAEQLARIADSLEKMEMNKK